MPAMQLEHVLEPSVAEKVPDPQLVQPAAPAEAKLPMAHFSQADEPREEE